MERSVDLIVSILAVLKAGGAWLPLDPSHPPDRLAFLQRDAGVRLLLTHARLAHRLPAAGVAVLCPDAPDEAVAHGARVDAPATADDKLEGAARAFEREAVAGADGGADSAGRDAGNRPAITPDTLAYVIATSGSTGAPKAAMLTHAGLVNISRATIARFGITPATPVLQFATSTFDASVWQVFMALHAGATLVLVDGEAVYAPDLLAALITRHAVAVADLPPAMLALLDPARTPTLRAVSTGGERCTRETVARWSAGRRFFNVYGPTETTVAATWHEVRRMPPEGQHVPIGIPIAGTRLYVLDDLLSPVPTGVAGDLYIGGVGVGRGYLGRPGATAERFLPDPFAPEPGARMYRSGDRARWLADGTLDFLGRADDQVKVRGFRIEPGEIEAALRRHPRVADAVVLAREDAPGDRRLVAYVVTHPGVPAPALGDLRAHLAERLPAYMLPAAWVLLDALPRLANRKVDRQALPPPAPGAAGDSTAFVAPSSPEERQIAAIWSEALGGARIGAADDFFALGGHSLLAARVMARVNAIFATNLPLRTLFERPSVAGLAAAVVAARQQEPNLLAAVLEDVARLSDDDVARLLAEDATP